MKKSNFKKICFMMVVVLIMTMFAGCSNKNSADSDQVTITIGSWPSESASEVERKTADDNLAKMNELYPNIVVKKDTSTFEQKSFTMKASSGQLPTLYQVPFTEFVKIVDSGYAADITDAMKKYGYDQDLNPLLNEFLSMDGKYYAIPQSSYALGLLCNKKLFTQAGLVNEDGTIKIPQTYDEVKEFSKIIKEKTGAYGFAVPTMQNEGGWFFSMVAWNFGTNFIEKDETGKYKASFNSPECVEALDFYREMKWDLETIPNNAFLTRDDTIKMFASDQVAMIFNDRPSKGLTTRYGMDKDDMIFVRVPEGKNGRITLMGGTIYMVSPDATEAEIDAAFKWLEVIGAGPNITEFALESKEKALQEESELEVFIPGVELYSVWQNGDKIEKTNKLYEKYTTVSEDQYSDYTKFTDVILHKEEYPCCQQLYTILDEGIQKIYSDSKADVGQTVKEMAEKFQINHLDKWEVD